MNLHLELYPNAINCNEIILKDKYKSNSQIYKGLSTIYVGTEIATKLPIIMKRVLLNKSADLFTEYKKYKIIHGIKGVNCVPKTYYFGLQADNYCYMVLEQLGPNLDDFYSLSSKKLSIKTLLILADKLLACLEIFHSRNYVHCNLDPSNIIISLNNSDADLCFVDLTNAIKYRDPVNGALYKEEPISSNKLPPNQKFASLGAHYGMDQSRRDDLESVGYILMYFYMGGKLPWDYVKSENVYDINEYTKFMKSKLFENNNNYSQCPVEIAAIIKYSRLLKFEDVPDYYNLRKSFKDIFDRDGYNNDINDWTSLRKLKISNENEKPKDSKYSILSLRSTKKLSEGVF